MALMKEMDSNSFKTIIIFYHKALLLLPLPLIVKLNIDFIYEHLSMLYMIPRVWVCYVCRGMCASAGGSHASIL